VGVPQPLVTLTGRSGEVPAGLDVRVMCGKTGPSVGVRVSPSARRTKLAGLYGDRLKLFVASPPADGRANAEVERSLAAWLGLAGRQVSVQAGRTSRDKVVAFFKGITEADLRARLAKLLQKRPGGGERSACGQEGSEETSPG